MPFRLEHLAEIAIGVLTISNARLLTAVMLWPRTVSSTFLHHRQPRSPALGEETPGLQPHLRAATDREFLRLRDGIFDTGVTDPSDRTRARSAKASCWLSSKECRLVQRDGLGCTRVA
jgi:hypothetical protein